ncbi:MAG: hypothetical protein MJ033_05685 [Victivallaceae bacterium]|nr:hypothetical protein [Victivallaceae bacterium]
MTAKLPESGTLAADTPQYRSDAYDFVAAAVNFTVEKLPRRRHVSARELLDGAREFAEREYGAVAPLVLNEWGIYTAHDVGFLVYRMIRHGILAADEKDDPQDFEIDYSFSQEPLDFSGEIPKIR